MIKTISFNINGIRARPHQLQAIIDQHQPDVIGLQETKVDDPQFPEEMVTDMGYEVVWHGQKAHYGVALVYNAKENELIDVQKGFPTDEKGAQRRMIIGHFKNKSGKTYTVMNGYFPQGESRDHPVKFPAKEKFYSDLHQYLKEKEKPENPIILMGDMNISTEDIDIGIGEENRKRWLRTGKCSFLPEEREWLSTIKDWGFIDTYRHFNPDVNDRFSWFDYRSKGFNDEPKRGLRIDLILATQTLLEKCIDTGIDYDIRGMEKPSDHCPIWASFDL